MGTGVVFCEEKFDDVIEEARPILERHYREIAWNTARIPLVPDDDRYRVMEQAGRLKIHTARKGGTLIGYAVWIVAPHLHYRETLVASNDILYIDAQHRGRIGAQLLAYSEAELKAMGVQVLGLHIKRCFDWGRLAERLGFENTEANYHKWIGS